MSEQTIFGEGFIFKRPHENAPSFAKGSMSVKVDEAIAFLQKHQDRGWVNLDLLASKDNTKLYFKLNTFKPKTQESSESVTPNYPTEEVITPEDIPF